MLFEKAPLPFAFVYNSRLDDLFFSTGNPFPYLT